MPTQEADRAPTSPTVRSSKIGANLTGAKYTLAVPAYATTPACKRLQGHSPLRRRRSRIRSTASSPATTAIALVLKMLKEKFRISASSNSIESSEQGMLAQVERAVRDKEPIVFLGWEPHPMNMRFDMQVPVRRRCRVRTELRRRDDLHGHPQGLQSRMPERRPAARQSEVHAARRERNDGGDSGSARAAADRRAEWLKANPDVVKPGSTAC
jgi:hypothetical protein